MDAFELLPVLKRLHLVHCASDELCGASVRHAFDQAFEALDFILA